MVRQALRIRADLRMLDEVEMLLVEIREEIHLDGPTGRFAGALALLVDELEASRALDLNTDGEFEALRDRALLLLAEVRMANGRPADDAGRGPR
ncbi:hypothetical protein GCM10022221_23770 [Actinocorallia aurea]